MTERTRKTPAQKATEELDVANRVADRLVAKIERLDAERKAAHDELAPALRRCDYLAGSPDLPAVMARHDGPSSSYRLGEDGTVYSTEGGDLAKTGEDPGGVVVVEELDGETVSVPDPITIAADRVDEARERAHAAATARIDDSTRL